MNREILDNLKIAIVHDYLNQYGGAERVLEILHEMFPDAPIYTLLYDKEALPQYSSWDIRPSILNKFPGMKQNYKYFLPLLPLAAKSFDLSDYDLVISMSHAWVKSVKVRNGIHLNYCLTPVRYAWDLYDDYLNNEYIPLIARKILPFLAACLRAWDKWNNRNIDQIVAISNTIKDRIKKFYDMEAGVIYPPVNTTFFCPDKNVKREDYYIIVSRLKAYKRIDLIIEAFNQIGVPLKVVGQGPEYGKFKNMASSNIEFCTGLSDEEVRDLYRSARAFVFAGVEDFGIVNVEALACGLPVIAYNKGGATEVVKDGISGILYDDQTVDSLVGAIKRFESTDFDSDVIRKEALAFDSSVFKEKVVDCIENLY